MITELEKAPPSWYETYRRSYLAGEAHAFLLTGDVEGIAVEDMTARRFLRDKLLARYQIVAIYHLAGGITIAEPDQKLAADPELGRPEETRMARARAFAGFDQPEGKAAPAAGGIGNLLAALGPQPDQGGDDDPFKAARGPLEALPLLTTLLEKGPEEGVAVVLDYADKIAPAPPMAGAGAMSPADRVVLVTLQAWAKDAFLAQHGNPIFMIARDAQDIAPELRLADSGWRVVRIPLPDRDARAAYLDWYLDRREARGKPIPLEDGLDREELANLTAGLSLRNIEDILLLAYRAGTLTRLLLKEHKDQIISATQSDIAQMIEPLKNGFGDLGGMERLKDWARESLIAPVRDGRINDVPKGVLLVGPPGSGKTYFVRALAKEVGFSGVTLESDKILGGIVGESERKLARFFAFVRAMAPCLVFMDELDQSDMSRRGNGSGNPVASNLFNQMLQFLSDETLRGKVIVVFGSNRPDLMDPALLRFGRMDAIIPVLLPAPDERAGIIRVQAKGQGIGILDGAVERIVERSEGYSSADLGAVVRKARVKAQAKGLTEIRIEHAEAALFAIRPSSTSTARQYTLLAINACNDRDLLPPEYATLLNNRAAIEAELGDNPLDRPRPSVSDERRERRERD